MKGLFKPFIIKIIMSENQTENKETNLRDPKSESTGKPLVIHKPRKKSTIRRHTVEIIASAIIVAVVITIGLCLLYTFNNNDETIQETVQYESHPETVDPVINLLSQFGRIKMNGQVGTVPTTFEMDFNNEDGYRYRSSSPITKYVLKIRHAQIRPDNSFHIVLTDYLEGRIAIGRFDGILSKDGSVFSGEYTNRHGKVREFLFER